MPYSSGLTDKEGEIIEPLLPKRKRTKPPKWSQREILDGILDRLKNGCPKGYRFAYNWSDLPTDLPPYSTVFWHYQQWRHEGIIDEIRDLLHCKIRSSVKKS